MKKCRASDLDAPANVREAIGWFIDRLRADHQSEFTDVILFGSAAVGGYGADSDVDLLVRWNGDAAMARAWFATLQEQALERFGVLLSPLPIDQAYWQRSRAMDSRFYRSVQAEGLRVAS